MGFFDSVIDPATQGGATGTQQDDTSVATAAAPAPSEVSEDNSFLIIDDRVDATSVPDTVSESVNFSEALVTPEVSVEEAPASEAILFDVPTVEAPIEAVTVVETPIEAVVEAPVEAVVEVVQVETPSFQSFVEMPAVATFAPASPVSSTSVSSEENPEEILNQAISRLESVVSAKETERDETLQKTEALNAQIAELKKQAKDSQDRAREIDASADRARSLITNLKSQLKAA